MIRRGRISGIGRVSTRKQTTRRSYFVDVKKLRGLRRHYKRTLRWQQTHVPLAMNGRTYDYRKIWLRPWSDFNFGQQPPLTLRRELLRGLLRTHAAWLRELSAQHATSFYLAIWVFERAFTQSQVVAGIGGSATHYLEVFEPDSGANQALPLELRRLPEADQLEWHCCVEIITDYDPPVGKVSGYRQRVAEDGQIFHQWEGTRVWVGRATKVRTSIG